MDTAATRGGDKARLRYHRPSVVKFTREAICLFWAISSSALAVDMQSGREEEQNTDKYKPREWPRCRVGVRPGYVPRVVTLRKRRRLTSEVPQGRGEGEERIAAMERRGEKRRGTERGWMRCR